MIDTSEELQKNCKKNQKQSSKLCLHVFG